jgi:hypothetical protein
MYHDGYVTVKVHSGVPADARFWAGLLKTRPVDVFDTDISRPERSDQDGTPRNEVSVPT